ncbi:MAG: M17 family peptidase N-terminal domain-containing protein, partial [SAR324 cluster bacterium]|nr:M17 family peptidase N-terminal domain-containing protein [SAR324 cluster bacterium]
MELKVEISNIPLKNEKLDALIVFVAEDTNVYGSGLSGLPDELKKLLNASLKLKVFSGKKGSKQHFVSGYTKIPQMLAVGLGKKDELDTEALRRAAGNAGKMLSGLKANSVGFLLTSLFKESTETDVGQVIVEGLALGAYEFNVYKTKRNNKSKVNIIKIHCCDPEKITSLKALKYGKIFADGTNLAR